MIAFSAGCFWGAEQSYRKLPGVVATAVGYTGGTSTFPSYEVAHQTGHLETVLVEFDPQRTSLGSLMKVFWTLPRTRNAESTMKTGHLKPATIWTYNSADRALVERSRREMEGSLKYKLAVNVLPARPFYLAEAYHQQYNERSGMDLCPALP